jgi:hypothetical protein
MMERGLQMKPMKDERSGVVGIRFSQFRGDKIERVSRLAPLKTISFRSFSKTDPLATLLSVIIIIIYEIIPRRQSTTVTEHRKHDD